MNPTGVISQRKFGMGLNLNKIKTDNLPNSEPTQNSARDKTQGAAFNFDSDNLSGSGDEIRRIDDDESSIGGSSTSIVHIGSSIKSSSGI